MNSGETKVLIVDDESDARSNIIQLLKKGEFGIGKLLEASNSNKAKEIILTENPDIIFLDIAMPVKSGFDLLAELPEIQSEVIFITSFNQYAQMAFKNLAIGYLVKPIDPDDFEKTVQKAITVSKNKSKLRSYKHLLDILGNKNTTSHTKIMIPTENEIEIVSSDEILYFEGLRNYSRCVCHDRKLIVSKNLAVVENWLPESDFVRIHKSYIVNIHKIKSIKNNGELLMVNADEIYMSKSKKALLLDKLSNI